LTIYHTSSLRSSWHYELNDHEQLKLVLAHYTFTEKWTLSRFHMENKEDIRSEMDAIAIALEEIRNRRICRKRIQN